MQRYDYQFVKQLEQKLKQKKKPIRLKIQNQYIPLVLTKTAQLRLINKGFVCLTVNQLHSLIKDCKTKEEQRKKVLQKAKAMEEGLKTVKKVKDIFDGTITDFK